MITASTRPLSSRSSGEVKDGTSYFRPSSSAMSGTRSHIAVSWASATSPMVAQWFDPIPPVPITPIRTFSISVSLCPSVSSVPLWLHLPFDHVHHRIRLPALNRRLYDLLDRQAVLPARFDLIAGHALSHLLQPAVNARL